MVPIPFDGEFIVPQTHNQPFYKIGRPFQPIYVTVDPDAGEAFLFSSAGSVRGSQVFDPLLQYIYN